MAGKAIDMTGKRIGDLEVVGRDLDNPRQGTYWKCYCLICGNTKSFRGDRLRGGRITNCGCAPEPKNFDSLVGQRFNRLLVLEKDKEAMAKRIGRDRETYWKCQCDCGNITTVKRCSLVTGSVKSCGCLGNEAKIKDITGQKFGKLTALYRTGEMHATHSIWHCKCDCGNECDRTLRDLREGFRLSCGCEVNTHNSRGETRIEEILIKHNISFLREYRFDGFVNPETNRDLRYDFAIIDSNNNVLYLIEYDGEQHFQDEETSFFNIKGTAKRDALKNQYALEYNIPLIRIPYIHYNDLCIEDLKLETSTFIIGD